MRLLFAWFSILAFLTIFIAILGSCAYPARTERHHADMTPSAPTIPNPHTSASPVKPGAFLRSSSVNASPRSLGEPMASAESLRHEEEAHLRSLRPYQQKDAAVRSQGMPPRKDYPYTQAWQVGETTNFHAQSAGRRNGLAFLAGPTGGGGGSTNDQGQKRHPHQAPRSAPWTRYMVSAYSHGCTCERLVITANGLRRCESVRPPGEYQTRSGVMPSLETIASPDLPFGTRIEFAYRGITRSSVVQDRMEPDPGPLPRLDMFLGSCADADAWGRREVFGRVVR